MSTAIKILAVILGIVAGVQSYPWLNSFLLAFLAFLGAVAIGVIVYFVAERLLREILG